jgi:hypothetical protein
VPRGADRAHFERLPVPLALWQSFEECLSDHLSELSEGQISCDARLQKQVTLLPILLQVVGAEAAAAA